MAEASLPADGGADASGIPDPRGSQTTEGSTEVARLRRVLRLHNAINRALLQADDEAELFDQVCETVLDVGGYRLVWIGRVEHDEARSISPVAQAGYEEGYLGRARITWADEPRGHGPSGRAARSGQPQIAQDILDDPTFEPWREEALERGYASSAAIPVPVEGETELLLHLYAEAPDAFQPTELSLLADVGVDLGRGLLAIRDRQARAKAEAEARRWGHAFEHASWGMALSRVDSDTFERVNPAFARMHGYQREELEGLPIETVFADGEWERVQPVVDEASEAGEALFEADHVQKDGTPFPARVHVAIVGDEDDRPAYRIASVEDISEQEEVQAQLKQRAEELTRTNAELERFAFVASHDLKEPVRTINSFAQLLERQAGDDLDPMSQESLRFILEAAQRLYSLIQDLLEYSGGRHRPLRLERIDLDDLIDQVQVRLRDKIQETRAVVLAEELPIVQADRTALGQAIEQLVDNALRYSGDQPPLVHIWAREHPDRWELIVRDEGIGIREEDQERIFDLFSRPDRKTAASGSGMGLAIVRSAVRRHGGEVWVESVPGEGSTFHIEIPDEPSRSVAPAAAEVTGADADDAPPRAPSP